MFQPPTRYGTYFPKLRWLVAAGHSDWELTLCRWDQLVVPQKMGKAKKKCCFNVETEHQILGYPIFRQTYSGWWLSQHSEKYEFVSWDYYSNIYIYRKNVPNHQPVILGTDCFADLFSARWLSNVAALVCREHIRPVSFCVRRCACHHTRHTRWFPACGGRSWEEKRYRALKTTRMLESKGLVFPISFCTHRVRFEEPKHGFGWCPGVGKTSCLRLLLGRICTEAAPHPLLHTLQVNLSGCATLN